MSYFLYVMVVGTLFPDDDRRQAEKAEEGTPPEAQVHTNFKSASPTSMKSFLTTLRKQQI